jgi:hypothetical protein
VKAIPKGLLPPVLTAEPLALSVPGVVGHEVLVHAVVLVTLNTAIFP